MHLNIGEADFSQGMLLSAIAIYALAMLAYACDFAFGRRPAASGLAATPASAAAEPELIGAAVAAPGVSAAAARPHSNRAAGPG